MVEEAVVPARVMVALMEVEEVVVHGIRLLEAMAGQNS